ncbi:endonuclease/exonuclease/phosphatase family protein [Allomuricauda sp. d1]|uniref:endonuclease/exonuclease/phosphatase family protein n=1 Tax=Allomuricauda sp. d1 TaxID=3136725 RepID=UPI0031D6DB3C
MLKKKRKALVSGLALFLGFIFFGSFYRFGTATAGTTADDVLKVMTFNVRNFNNMRQIDKPDVDSLIMKFLERENPDIICIQEANYALKRSNVPRGYEYKYVDFVYGEPTGNVIQAIYSKYPILKIHTIDFRKSHNTAMYADILMGVDTIRLFNLHLQSFNIIPEMRTLQKEDSKKLFGRLQTAFKKQQQQTELIAKYLDSTKSPKIVVGDFNNTQFSNSYQTVKGDMADTFLEKGSGFGKTYSLFGLPMRIDYILADETFEVVSHKNYDVVLSDHYPVMATLQLKSEE